ncbi:MAG: Na(+)/H(+) antiporter subunit D [Desulfobacterales bacterium]
MISGLHPSFILIAGSLLIPFLKGKIKSFYMLILPLLALASLINIPEGNNWVANIMNYQLILGRIDRLSLVFAYIFTTISFIGILFAVKVEDDLQHVSSLIYAGSATGVVLAGDLFSVYIFWELMAISSTFLILARKTDKAQAAAFRYIMMHVFGGLCLLGGIVLHTHQSGSSVLSLMELKDLSSYLIFAGIALNAAIFPLHPWLTDAYPEATYTGAVFLSAFTTKSAVYLMARIFPGADLLIMLGVLMAIIPAIYAAIENDLRRVISFSLISQGGFMMCGIGMGTPLSINGAVSHAFCCVIYIALLFMATGSVLNETGKIKCTELGGLYRTMPITCAFCITGALSISALPLFSGFVSKSMVISASAHEKIPLVWLALQFASATACFHSGAKVPYFTFFGKDSGIKAKEPPLNMLIAMGIVSAMCVIIGVFPGILYDLLPYPVEYIPYTSSHVINQMQIVLFGALAFSLLVLSGYSLEKTDTIILDTDWFYRKGGKIFFVIMDKGLNGINSFCNTIFAVKLSSVAGQISRIAPFLFALILLLPFKILKGESKEARTLFKENLDTAIKTGSAPVGISAAFAVFFLIIAYFLI